MKKIIQTIKLRRLKTEANKKCIEEICEGLQTMINVLQELIEESED